VQAYPITSTANDLRRDDYNDPFFLDNVGKVSVPNLLQTYY